MKREGFKRAVSLLKYMYTYSFGSMWGNQFVTKCFKNQQNQCIPYCIGFWRFSQAWN